MSLPRMPLLLLSLSIPALFSGCETTDKMLGAAERAVGSSTGRTVLDIVGGKDPAEIARRRVENYGRDPKLYCGTFGRSSGTSKRSWRR